jgi:hypothetical protein
MMGGIFCHWHGTANRFTRYMRRPYRNGLERHMHRSLVFFLSALLGLFVIGVSSRGAMAGPLPSIADLTVKSGVVEKTQYSRRYYRRQLRRGNIPPAVVVPPVVVQGGSPVILLRPTSCGQYHYWNGFACVDARYNNPDLGPTP